MQIPKSIFIRQRLFFLYCIQKKRGKFYVRRICITRWCDQQCYVQLSVDYHAAGGRTVFHTPKPFRTAPSASGINPGSRRKDRQQLRIRISGADGRVGTGNIVGVANAIAIGGYGAVFWMWLIAIVGGASAFVESTLAQIYKKRDASGGSYGGPSYYIEAALKSRALGVVFAIALIATYAGVF